MQELNWIFELKEKTSGFLERLKGKDKKGFFRYSLSGDLYDEKMKWGLGNTVFAAKIYYTLDLLDNLPAEEKTEIADFIKSFQRKDGTIYDPLIKSKAFFRNFLSDLRNFHFNNILGEQIIVAETRQAISALKLLGYAPEIPYQDFPKTEKEIGDYLSRLNWKKPWDAGSYFSHLMFFLKNSNLESKEDLIDFAIDWVNRLQNPKDGSWGKNNPTLQQKINGAMKIITGLKVAEKMSFLYTKELIDLCLSAKNDEHACDNFNIIYVLHYADKMAGKNYRASEIKDFAEQRLKIYRDYYLPDTGGFSFLPKRANIYYYGARITRGLREPDIHGTLMFLWGISIIAQILEVNTELNFKELIT